MGRQRKKVRGRGGDERRGARGREKRAVGVFTVFPRRAYGNGGVC